MGFSLCSDSLPFYNFLRNSLIFQGRVVSPAPNPQPGRPGSLS
jgi:hypothetical protein